MLETEREGMNAETNMRVVEAVLFALGRAASCAELARACGCTQTEARAAAETLRERYETAEGALRIRVFDGSYQMCSAPQYYEQLIRLVTTAKKPVLTEVVLETLSIIAYKNPATKVEIEKIRGVKSDHAVNKLIEYGLVEEVGRLDVPGRPALFAPTEEFYRRFGVDGTRELPKLPPEAEALIENEVRAELGDAMIGEMNGTDAEERAQAQIDSKQQITGEQHA